MALEVGNRVGDYEILALLGAGGMGRVYKVRNIISNREEAMKVLLPDFASDHDLAARLVAEIRTLAGLEHPNIAQLRTAFRQGDQFVMVMEYVEGTTLEKQATLGHLSLDQVLDYSMQALAALSFAHSRGVTHRDIKPANIMITDHGVVKLMDFGIAKSGGDMQLTRPGTTMGSVYYMSPEQVRGNTVDARSDIYSFGVTLYEMLTGRKPFQAETSYSVLNAQLNEAPTPPVVVNPALPTALNNIVLRAMVKAPEGRFQSAEEFRQALKALRDPQAQAAAIPMTQPMPAVSASSIPTPTVAAQPSFAPVTPNSATPINAAPAPAASRATSSGKSNRGLWIGLGAAAAVIALVAAFALLPRFFSTHAGQSRTPATPDAQTASATTDPTATTPPATPAADGSQPAASGSATPDASNSSAASATPAASAAQGAADQAATTTTASANPPARAPYKGKPSKTAVMDANSAAGTSASGQSIAPAGASAAEIREAHDKYSNLEARADSAKQGVQQIRTAQQAQGLDIRGDILTAMNRVTSELREANSALDRDDLQAAHSYMDKADRDIATLESFLGR